MKQETAKRRLALAAACAAFVLGAAACGSSGSSGSGSSGSGSSGTGSEETVVEQSGGMSGMDHSGMDHGSMDMASMLEVDGEYSDERFIDLMVPHHESAVEMAEVALQNSENERIRTLAEEIISAQERELRQMSDWRAEWYPNA